MVRTIKKNKIMIDKIIDRLNILEDLLINKCEIDIDLFQKIIKETQAIRELVLTIPFVGSSADCENEIDITRCPECNSSDHLIITGQPYKCMDCGNKWV